MIPLVLNLAAPTLHRAKAHDTERLEEKRFFAARVGSESTEGAPRSAAMFRYRFAEFKVFSNSLFDELYPKES